MLRLHRTREKYDTTQDRVCTGYRVRTIDGKQGLSYLLITASSSGIRKTLGVSFPGWSFGVTVPTSTKPKPTSSIPRTASQCLSKPAAIPTGFAKAIPNADVDFRIDSRLIQ